MAQEIAGVWQIKLNAGGYTFFTKVTPYLTVRAGMAINVVSQQSETHVPWYAVGELQGGLAIALNENLDLTCAAFSQRLEPIHTQVDKHGIGNIGLKVGFNMHF